MAVAKLPLTHLVVFIPGIGGSALATADGDTLWGGRLATFVANVLVPGSLHTNVNPTLTPTGLLSTAAHLPGFTAIHPYDSMIKRLRREFAGVRYDPGDARAGEQLDANLVAFPYDFRRSITHTSALLADSITRRLAHHRTTGGPDTVIIVAHSMGGLVARHWMTAHDGWNVCKALITLGTPHRGAPKAADWLVNGVNVLGFGLDQATDVIRSWDSVYELLPRYDAIHTYDNQTRSWSPTRPSRLGLAVWAGSAGRAATVHDTIHTGWQHIPNSDNGGPAVAPFFGNGHVTPLSLFHRDGRLWAENTPPTWLPATASTGDGTVPQLSAIPIELADHQTRWHPTPSTHGELGAEAAAIDLVRALNEPSTSEVLYNPATVDPPIIGTDLPGTIWAHQPHTIPLELVGVDDIPTPDWTVTLTPLDLNGYGTEPIKPTIAADGDRATITMPGLPPGDYTLKISTRLGLPNEPSPVTAYLRAVDQPG